MKKIYCFVGIVLSTILSSGDNSITTLDPSKAAAEADFPLVAAFIQDFTKYSYNDYVEALSSQGTTIPYVLNNYFLAFEELSNYQQVESVMMKTFPFSEFAAVVTEVPWYTELLANAEMSTIYFPSDFSTGIVVTLSANNNSSSPLATEAGSASPFVAVSATSPKVVICSAAHSTVSSRVSLTTHSSTSSHLISSSVLSVSSVTSVASKNSSTSSNFAANTLQSIPLLVFSFLFFLF